MFLVRVPNHFVGIGQGALAKNVLEKRILSSAAEAGWIDKTTLQASRAVRNDMKLMPSMSTQLPSLSDDPASMIEYLRKSARGFPSP
jgi:conjugal transfer pilus assembly protein TraF